MEEAFLVEFEVSLGPSRSLSYGDVVSPPAETSMLHLDPATVLIGPRHLFHCPLDCLPNAQCHGDVESASEGQFEVTARDESNANAKAEMVHISIDYNHGPRSRAPSVTP